MKTLNVHIVSSSSKGNAIFIDDGKSGLLLDAGVSYRRLLKSGHIDKLEGVLVTHEHKDHSHCVNEFYRRGAPIYMSKGTADKLYISNDYYRCRHMELHESPGWYIYPFEVEHDAKEPMGFLLESKHSGAKVVYIVDSGLINYDFTGVTHWILEANYDESILKSGKHEEWLKNRIRKSHFSIAGLKTFLSTSDLSETQEIYLVHLSDANSHEKNFIQEIQELTGVPVFTDSDFVPQTSRKTAYGP